MELAVARASVPVTGTIELRHSKATIRKAGKLLASGEGSEAERKQARTILSDWRAIHASPLNAINRLLGKEAERIDPDALVAQRLKRSRSIIEKLARNRTMALDRIQDIGGCRAVVRDVRAVDKLVESIKSAKRKHILSGEKNYIESPKDSGYRCRHLIFSYRSKRPDYNDLKIEIQVRTKKQHYWATAVETVSTFLDRGLKASEGPAEWLRFFSLTSSAFAYLEGTPPHPSAPPRDALIATLNDLSARLKVEETLTQYRRTLKTIKKEKLRGARYVLITLAPHDERLQLEIRSYKAGEINIATQDYEKAEEALVNVPNGQAVLLAVQHLESLKKAFPNYFLDTHLFLRTLKRALDMGRPEGHEIRVPNFNISIFDVVEQAVLVPDNTAVQPSPFIRREVSRYSGDEPPVEAGSISHRTDR